MFGSVCAVVERVAGVFHNNGGVAKNLRATTIVKFSVECWLLQIVIDKELVMAVSKVLGK